MPKQTSDDDNKSITKKVLLDTLGDFFMKVIAPYFDRIEDKLEEHDKHLDEHDEEFKKIDRRFDTIDRRFDTIEEYLFNQKDTLKDHEKRISTLESV